jgi:hypothetical protein
VLAVTASTRVHSSSFAHTNSRRRGETAQPPYGRRYYAAAGA